MRKTTKKVIKFLREKVHPRENPGYAYALLVTDLVSTAAE